MRGRNPRSGFFMAGNIDEINTLTTTALAAVDSEDWDAAFKAGMKIQARLATTPNISRSLAGGGNQYIAWTQKSIDEFIKNCLSKIASSLATSSSSGPYQQTNVTYTRAT